MIAISIYRNTKISIHVKTSLEIIDENFRSLIKM